MSAVRLQSDCMRLDPMRLLVLHAVAETGGILAAGQRLHLAPSGVSQHLAALERETRLQLVDRSRRGGQRRIQLTATGKRLADHAARLSSLLDHAEADLLTLTGDLHGSVTLAAFPTAMNRLVVPTLAALRQSHPAVSVRVVEVDEEPAVTAIRIGDIDLLITERDREHPAELAPGLTQRWLLDDPYRLALPSGWPAPDSLDDLAEEPWIDGPSGSAVARTLDTLRSSTGLVLPAAHRCVEFPAVLTLVAAGLGAALVPDLALIDGSPRSVRVLELPGLGGRSINVVHLRSQRARAVVRLVSDTLADVARSG